MIVSGTVVWVVLAGLLCWVVLGLDAYAKLRSVLVSARNWKAINIKFQIECDTGTPDSTTKHPPTVDVLDEPDQSDASTAGYSRGPRQSAHDPHARTRREQARDTPPKPDVAALVPTARRPTSASR